MSPVRHLISIFISLSAGFAVTALLPGCGDNQDEAGARELLAEVRAAKYMDWPHAPGYQTRRNSHAPHSDAVDIYVNPAVSDTLDVGGTAWPPGSVIVKEGWSGTELELIAIMEKRSDGWFWAEYDENGDPFYSGKPDVCIDCHRSGSDFVRAFALPAAP